jgi:hypothetical protein
VTGGSDEWRPSASKPVNEVGLIDRMALLRTGGGGGGLVTRTLHLLHANPVLTTELRKAGLLVRENDSQIDLI